MEAQFQSYDFASDEKWLSIERNLEIPPNRNVDDVMLKRKRKYYKDNVNSSYEPPVDSPKPNSTPASTTSSTAGPTPPPKPARPSYQHTPRPGFPTTFGKDPYGTRNNTNPSDFYTLPSSYGPHATFLQRYGVHFFSLFVVFATVLTPLIWVLVVGFGSNGYSSVIYTNVLRVSVLIAAIRAYSIGGKFRFSKEYLTTIVGSEQGLCFLSSLILLAAPESLPVLIPGFCLAFFPLAALTIPNLPSNLKEITNALPLPTTWAGIYSLVAKSELGIAVLQIPILFTSRRSLLFIVMLIQYIPMRYICSAYFRDACSILSPKIDAIFKHSIMPTIVQSYYDKLRAMLWNQVNPEELEKKSQNPQSCSIM